MPPATALSLFTVPSVTTFDDDMTMFTERRNVDDFSTMDLVDIRIRVGMANLAMAYMAPEDVLREVITKLVLGGFERNPLWAKRYPNSSRRLRTSGTKHDLYKEVVNALQLIY